MRLAFSTLGCPEWSAERVAKTAASLGYEGVEIRGFSGRMAIEEMPELGAELPRTRALFEDSGLSVCCLSVSVVLLAESREERRIHVDRARRAIEIAAELGCPYVRVFGGRIPAGKSRADAADDAAQLLAALGGRAAPVGVTVLLETHDDFCRGEHAADVVGRVAGPGVGVLWDILHPYRCGEAPADTVNFLGSSVGHVHVKDAVGLSADGFRPVLIGEGRVPVREFVRLLRQIGYAGFLSFEWEKAWHSEIAEPDVALPHFITCMREILREELAL